MWSEYITDRVVDRASSVVHLRDYENPLMVVHRFADAMLIVFATWAACWLNNTQWTVAIALGGFVASVLFYLFGVAKQLYRSWRTERLSAEIWRVLETWIGVAGITLVVGYIQQDVPRHSNDAIIYWFFLAPALLIGWRLVVRFFLRWARAISF